MPNSEKKLSWKILADGCDERLWGSGKLLYKVNRDKKKCSSVNAWIGGLLSMDDNQNGEKKDVL